MLETIHFEGRLRVGRVPFESEEEWQYWWPRMSMAEKERYWEAEARNVLTSAGKNQILSFITSTAAFGSGFGQIFSIGTGSLVGVQPSDPSVVTEFYRQAFGSTSITGNLLDMQLMIGGTNANGTWTNAGIYGGGATTTLGTGTLYTHTLFAYTKVTGNITVDYLITLV